MPASTVQQQRRPAAQQLAFVAPAPLSRLPPDAKRRLASLPLLPLALAALVAVIPTPVDAALSTFQISTPRQCAPLTLNWTTPSGSVAGADEPFNLVLIPTSDQNEVLSNLTFTSTGNRSVLFSPNTALCRRWFGRGGKIRKRGASGRFKRGRGCAAGSPSPSFQSGTPEEARC